MTRTMRVVLAVQVISVAAVASVGAQAALPRPVAPAVKPYVLPAFAVDTLPNGLRVAVLESHDLPFVAVRFGFAGLGPIGISYNDPAGKEGAWGLLLTALREGTTTRTANQIRDEIADLGSSVTYPSAPNFGVPGFNAAKSTWKPTLDILGDMLAHPALAADAVTRVQEGMATGPFARLSATQTAQRQALRAIFGEGSPLTRYATVASIRAITRDDVVRMQSEYLRPQNTMVFIGGDVTRAEARAAAINAFGSWAKSGTTIAPVAIPAPAPAATTIYLVDNPGATQSTILSMIPVPGRDTPSGAAVEALASALGDGANSLSRTARAFRTERGLAYSPTVSIVSRPAGETALLNATFSAVSIANTDTAVIEWVRLVRELRTTKPVADAELAFAKSNLVGSLPLTMERVDTRLANAVQAVIRDRLPPTYFNDWVKRMDRLTLADVQSVANRYLDPDHMAIVVVGDRSKVEAGLRATGIPVVIVAK